MEYVNPTSIAQMAQVPKDTSLPGTGYGLMQGWKEGEAMAKLREGQQDSRITATDSVPDELAATNAIANAVDRFGALRHRPELQGMSLPGVGPGASSDGGAPAFQRVRPQVGGQPRR